MNNETFFWCGAAPTPNRVGDTWFDTGSSWLYRWDGQAWIRYPARSPRIKDLWGKPFFPIARRSPIRTVFANADWPFVIWWALFLLFILFAWTLVAGAFMSADPPEIVPTGINELAAGAGNQFERLHTCSSGGMAAADVGVTRDYRSLWAASHARHVAIPHAGGSCGMRLPARAASRDRRLQ